MRQLVYISLLLIIALRLICGERKIGSTIKKSLHVITVNCYDCSTVDILKEVSVLICSCSAGQYGIFLLSKNDEKESKQREITITKEFWNCFK